MHRLFVAIRPPRAVRAQLLDLRGGIGGARWQNEDQLHLTLRFIGEVDRHVAEDVHAALSAVHYHCFEIALSGVGSFERRGRVDTVWAGVAPLDLLKGLHNKIDQAVARVGVAPDHRAYLPHITLARLNRASASIGDFVERSGGLTSSPFAVEAFCLYESQLAPEGPLYSVVERYKLD